LPFSIPPQTTFELPTSITRSMADSLLLWRVSGR
jgi:hypothetical protein